MKPGLSTAVALLLTWLLGVLPGQAATDPLDSARWGDMVKTVLGGQPHVFDSRVVVEGPGDAENPLQVPVTVDASALPGVEEVLVFADFNPIVSILRFRPGQARAYLGFRLKLQQSSPVRAAARTADGVWHVGGTWINTFGGGCTAPALGRATPDWQSRLNEVSARRWVSESGEDRLRLRIIHPMDTGLVAGIPAFHLEDIQVSDSEGRLVMAIEAYEPVSENPVFTLRHPHVAGLRAAGRDNNGNRFELGVGR